MKDVTRRSLLKAGSMAVASVGLLLGSKPSWASHRVVVIGAGVGGGTTAIALKQRNPHLRVTLVERDPTLLAPLANRPGLTDGARGVAYQDLLAADVNIAIDDVVGVDWTARQAVALSGRTFGFDHVVVAPGIAPRDEGIEGYDAVAAYEFPHAWASGRQAYRLQAQIEAMADGGTMIIRVPAGPQRYPQGPYERAERVARYLMREKPRSKIIILDAKDSFPPELALARGWADDIPKDMIEWVPASAGGNVNAVDVAGKRLAAGCGWIAGDVINFIPAQQAGEIARLGGLIDETGWCPVTARSMQSRLQPAAWVLGDANDAEAGGKTAEAAQRQAHSCAAEILIAG
jgi:NADPH-dependent 2,4-dienoyl-CoA reductase/sulfur reductase-like enzyme